MTLILSSVLFIYISVMSIIFGEWFALKGYSINSLKNKILIFILTIGSSVMFIGISFYLSGVK